MFCPYNSDIPRAIKNTKWVLPQISHRNKYNENMNEKKYKITKAKEEGPYYKAGSPEKRNLWLPGIAGEQLSLKGKVVDQGGQPMAGAWLDFWQADGNGIYDNQGFKLRGHQYTDKDGNYSLETVIPGAYAIRTPHLHVKVRASQKGSILTTQLFIPGKATNAEDFLYDAALLIQVEDTPNGKSGTFDFVV
jgi:protocatechuate 3,4-dioxygenase beta subunit